MEALRLALMKYVDASQILSLSAYKLQASRFSSGLAVQAAQGLQRSIVLYGITEYGDEKKSVGPNILNVAVTRTIDLFIMIGNRSQLIEATKRKTLLGSGKEVDSVHAFLD